MRGYLLLTISALIVGIAISTSGTPAQNNSARGNQRDVDKAEFESQFPTTDVNKPEPSDHRKRSRWQAKSKKYKRIGLPITESGELITYNTEWDIGLPALPVSKSDLVIIGQVTEAQAYVSQDKNWVYSEFTISVDEVLKNTSAVMLTSGGSLTADRDGGGVRFPSGRITRQYVAGQGMPRVGQRYTLFLTDEGLEQGVHILTGYELRAGRVFPLDNPAGVTYKNADEASFLSDLRAAIVKAQ